jgi:hypothetical protein
MANSLLATPTKRGQPERYTAQQVIDAVTTGKGLVTVAARHLGCHPDTIRRYRREYPTVAAAFQVQREGITDMAEAALYKAINDGQPWAVCFYLKTQGRDRGYIERHENDNTGEVTILVKYANADADD